MVIKSLRVQNFRNHKDFSLEFSPGVNIIIGPNGSGKTSVLEAIYIAGKGKSFRSRLKDTVRRNKSWMRVDLFQNNSHYTVKFKDEDTQSKEFLLDEGKIKPPNLSLVLFEPEFLRSLHGSPDLRREWMDAVLSATNPEYKSNLRNYQKALRQRNALLKDQHTPAKDAVFVWDIKLSEYGAQVAKERKKLAQLLDKRAQSLYGKISSQKENISFEYTLSCSGQDYASALLKQLDKSYLEDSRLGFTTCGPHREDLRIEFRGKPIAENASRGEVRTLALVCKLIEMEVVEETAGEPPALLLDDMFSELDAERRKHLQAATKKHQVIITTTDDSPIKAKLIAPKKVIKL